MIEQINGALELIKQQKDIDGCITGSILLDIVPEWHQDVDIFVYNKSSFNKLLFFMHYHPMFLILDKLEQYKFDEYINNDKSSADKLYLITIKFKYNLCIDINVIYKPHYKTIFDVLSAFDMDLIATGYDIKSGKTLSLRESTGKVGTWNRWNMNYYNHTDFWSVRRVINLNV